MENKRSLASNRFSTRPMYLQLRDALAERIVHGEWKPGMALPNESDLAREFGVSSGTMRKALDMMEGEDLLTRREGRGTFVNDQSSDEMAMRFNNVRNKEGQRVTGRVRTLELAEGKANERECKRLALQPHDTVYRMRRVRLHGDKPFMWEEASYPASLFPGLMEAKNPSHRITVLAQQYHLLLGKSEERISIGRASPKVATDLDVAPDSPVMVLDRVLHDLDGRPVEWRVGYCHFTEQYYLADAGYGATLLPDEAYTIESDETQTTQLAGASDTVKPSDADSEMEEVKAAAVNLIGMQLGKPADHLKYIKDRLATIDATDTQGGATDVRAG